MYFLLDCGVVDVASKMKRENELAKIIVDLCYRIHTAYGPGLFESVYERILVYELEKLGLKTEVHRCIPLHHESLFIPTAFKADIIVEGCVLIELKSVEQLPPLYYKQVLTYLKLADLKLGLLINFNVDLIKNGIRRIVNDL
jgi:GxxExxY protein